MGEMMDPCETPAVYFVVIELILFMQTEKQRLRKKDLIILKISEWVFNAFN